MGRGALSRLLCELLFMHILLQEKAFGQLCDVQPPTKRYENRFTQTFRRMSMLQLAEYFWWKVLLFKTIVKSYTYKLIFDLM